MSYYKYRLMLGANGYIGWYVTQPKTGYVAGHRVGSWALRGSARHDERPRNAYRLHSENTWRDVDSTLEYKDVAYYWEEVKRRYPEAYDRYKGSQTGEDDGKKAQGSD